MKLVLKTTLLLFVFFLFLCINIGDKPIFAHFYKLVSPATNYVQNKTEDFFNSSVSSTQTYSKKLFDNSIPRVKDSVDSKLSSRLKKAAGGEPEERITNDEKAELDQLIKNH